MGRLGEEKEFGLEEKLAKGIPLRIKIGFDPTSPDLHLGHSVVLKGARKLQDMGHKVVLIVGDFTASIGDPSGRNKLRPALSKEEIEENAKTYMSQAFMILDEGKTEVRRNGEWLAKLGAGGMLSLLSRATLSQTLARDDFKNRHDEGSPVFLHEMAYPLLQGYDSVAVKADVELGGTDQTFNLMAGRQLQKSFGESEQAVATFPLLVGLDGRRKMSKSLGNHIGLTDSPKDKFGKTMSISDETMWSWLVDLGYKSEAGAIAMRESGMNPRDAKVELAKAIVSEYHGIEMAEAEAAAFFARFSKKDGLTTDLETVVVEMNEDEMSLSKLMRDLSMASSISDANRKIEQRGVKLDGARIEDKRTVVERGSEFVLSVGKLSVKKIRLK